MAHGPMGPGAHGLMGPWAHGLMGPWAAASANFAGWVGSLVEHRPQCGQCACEAVKEQQLRGRAALLAQLCGRRRRAVRLAITLITRVSQLDDLSILDIFISAWAQDAP